MPRIGAKMLEIKANMYRDQRATSLKSRQMCTDIMASVPENPVLKKRVSIPITWVSMPEINSTVPETSTVHMKSGPRFLKSMQMCKEIRASLPENPGLKINAIMPITWVSMPEIQAKVPRNQDQGVCHYRKMPETRTVWLGIRAKMLQIMANVHRNHGQCF